MMDKIKEMTCICCPIGCCLKVEKAQEGYKVSGNKCPRGVQYAIEEMSAPKRFIASTVRIDGWIYPVISVKTVHAIPKEKIFEVMDVLSDVVVKAPMHVGDVIVKDVLGTGVDIVATRNASVMGIYKKFD